MLHIAPSTYYAAKTRPPSSRSRTDEATTAKIHQVHADNYAVYGARKVHAELNRQGHRVARCTVQRLMKQAGLRGISRTKQPRTTVGSTTPDTRLDLVERAFTADAPNQLWVTDITYIRTFAGWVYAAFVIDVFSRRVVGWQVSRSLRTNLALDAWEMAVWNRQHVGRRIDGLVHHSDRGVQGGFNWSSQHLDHEGVRWDASTSRYLRCLRERDGSGRRIGCCDLRCAHRAALSPLVRCSGTSGGGSRRA